MTFMNEFKKFAMRGNVLDLAIGMIIGAAFTGIVKSIVDNILSPVLGLDAIPPRQHLVLNQRHH